VSIRDNSPPPDTPLLPPLEGLFGNPQVADQIGHRCPHLGLLEHGHDLLDTESFAFHSILLPPAGANYAGNSPSWWYKKGGAGHEDHLTKANVRRLKHDRGGVKLEQLAKVRKGLLL